MSTVIAGFEENSRKKCFLNVSKIASQEDRGFRMAWMETVLSLRVVEPLFWTAGRQIALMRDTKLV